MFNQQLTTLSTKIHPSRMKPFDFLSLGGLVCRVTQYV
jgi:hypothetical protein